MRVSDLMQAMADMGAPMEAILIAVRALEDKQAEIDAAEAAKADKRAKDAARKRDARNADAPRTIHGHSTDAARTDEATPPLSAPPNDIYSNPPHQSPPKSTKRARGGSRLPDDWEPKPLTGDTAAAVASWPVGAIERELARFRDWAASATGPNAVKSNWDAAWRNWLRRIEDEGKYGRKNNHSGGRDNRDGVAKALDRRLGLDPFAEPVGRSTIGSGARDSGSPVAYLADLR